jgi:translation elongation factor EF-Tu-like GTPase
MMAKRLVAAVTIDLQGRRTPIQPRTGTYRPHLVPDGSSLMLGVQFVNGPASLSPGDTGDVEIECLYDISYEALQPSVRFAIVEGPHRIGRGVVLKVSAAASRSR